MTVRGAERRDARRITELLRTIAKLHSDGRPDIYKPTMKHDEASVEKMINNPDNIILVAVDESDVVFGYIICNLKTTAGHHLIQDSKVLWVDDFCVDENARGQGCGTLLSDAVKKYAEDENCNRIELNVWQFNEGARRFYEKFGMTPQRTIMEMKL